MTTDEVPADSDGRVLSSTNKTMNDCKLNCIIYICSLSDCLVNSLAYRLLWPSETDGQAISGIRVVIF